MAVAPDRPRLAGFVDLEVAVAAVTPTLGGSSNTWFPEKVLDLVVSSSGPSKGTSV